MPSILIVSAFFPPSLRIGSRRPARMASFLARSGWDVTVLTMHEERYDRPVDMPPLDLPSRVQVIRTGVWMPVDALRRSAVQLARRFRGGSRTAASSGDREEAGRSAIAALASAREGPGGDAAASAGAGGDPAARPARVGPSPASAFSQWCARRMADLEFPDKYAVWLPRALFAAPRRRWDVVLGTIPAYTPAVVARILGVRSGAALVLDYRDPWTEAPRRDFGEGWHEGLRERHRRLEDWCLDGASLVVGVAPGICRLLEPRTRAEVLLVPNSFDEDDPLFARGESAGQAAKRDGRTLEAPGTPSARTLAQGATGSPARLVYAGTLAYGRSLDPVFAALARVAPDLGPDRLRFVYAGPDGARARAEARAQGVERSLEDLGTIGTAAAAGLARDATAIVVAVSEGYEYQYPGKIFDVAAAGRPVLLLAPAGADAADLVRRHGLGWSHEPSDVEGLAASIRRAVAGETTHPSGLEAFETKRVMGALDTALRRLVR